VVGAVSLVGGQLSHEIAIALLLHAGGHSETMINKKEQRLGKLPRRYTFMLNPYAEYRFTRCPGCDRKMRQRKLPP
jgi:hypothetical protein